MSVKKEKSYKIYNQGDLYLGRDSYTYDLEISWLEFFCQIKCNKKLIYLGNMLWQIWKLSLIT